MSFYLYYSFLFHLYKTSLQLIQDNIFIHLKNVTGHSYGSEITFGKVSNIAVIMLNAAILERLWRLINYKLVVVNSLMPKVILMSLENRAWPCSSSRSQTCEFLGFFK